MVNFIPGGYFFRSRLNSVQAMLFHGWYEWIAGILIIAYFAKVSLFTATWDFIIAYLPFIALYEIGYLVNDYYSIRKEDKPRIRIEGFQKTEEWEILSLILVRGLFFLVFVYFSGIGSLNWMFFCFILLIVFGLHNFIQPKEIKFITFVSLALLRFMLPLIPFLHVSQLQVILPGVLLNYVLYRTLSYLDSKDNLQMPSRKEPWFKLSYYILLIPASLVLMIVYEDSFSLMLNLFYLAFWGAYFVKFKVKGS